MTVRKEQIFTDAMRTLAMVLDYDEGEKVWHAWRVGLLSLAMGRAMGLGRPDLLYYAGLLHDIGAVGLEDHVIHHARKGFSNPEARGHSERGASIVRPFLPQAGLDRMILEHHERYDGAGFPFQKTGDEISPQAAIIHMADILDVGLRNAEPSNRLQKGLRLAALQSGQTVAAEVSQAATAAMEADQEAFLALFDPDGLKKQVMAVLLMPRELEQNTHLELLGQTLWLFSRVIDAKTPFIMGHSVRVAWLASRIAGALGEEGLNLWDVVWAGLLHDVGVMGLPRHLLEGKTRAGTTGKLLMASHPAYTVEIMSNMRAVAHLAFAAGSHHEHYDGRGYPHGSLEEAIPLLGRVLAFADYYDRLTTMGAPDKLSHGQALARMKASLGERLDPRLGETALDVLDACGAQAVETPEALEDFNRLFDTDKADPAALVSADQALVTETGRAYIPKKQGQWQTFSLDSALRVCRGKAAFRKAFPQAQQEDFLSAVSLDEKDFVRERLEKAGGEGLVSWTQSAPGGPLKEVLALGRKDRLDIYLRDAEAPDDPLRKTSLIYQSFLFSREPVVFADASDRIVDANQAFLDLFGKSLDRIQGKGFKELGLDMGNIRPGQGAERARTGPDGQDMYLLVSVQEVRDAAGSATGRIWRFSDITLRKRMERELEGKNRELVELNRLKSDMLAITSHDMKSPLGGIIGYARMLQDLKDVLTDEEKSRYLDTIIDSGNHLVRFINDILDASRIESNSLELFPEEVGLDQLIREVIKEQEPVADQRRVAIRYEAPEEAPSVQVDRGRIRQVLANVLSNAVKFSPDAAAIKVKYKTNGSGGHVVRVEDQGPGIPEEDRERIFERYYQVTRGKAGQKASLGSGLGLYIARNLILGHGGDMSVSPGLEKGSCFTIRLPGQTL